MWAVGPGGLGAHVPAEVAGAVAPAQQIFFEAVHRPSVARFSDFFFFFKKSQKSNFLWVASPD